jgi:LysR family pca operon transcriptional activator
MHPAIKLRHIRAFLDIAAEGGLSAVARAQGISQPALSRTLAELEALLGEALFDRQGRRLVLTEAGVLFRRHAGAALAQLDAGAAALRPGAGGTLRVGVLPTVATRFLPELALRFRALRPEIGLAIETGPHFHLMRLLREGAVDLVLGRLPGAAEIAGLSFDHLYEDEVILAARAGHPLAGRPAAQALGDTFGRGRIVGAEAFGIDELGLVDDPVDFLVDQHELQEALQARPFGIDLIAGRAQGRRDMVAHLP